MGKKDADWNDVGDVWEGRALHSAVKATVQPVRSTLKVFLGGTAIVVALILFFGAIGGLISTGSVFWQGAQAKITAAPRVEKATYDTSNILAQKVAFTQDCRAIADDYGTYQINEQALALLEQQIKSGVVQDPTGTLISQASTQALGPQDAVLQAIAAYDAKADNTVDSPFIPNGYPKNILQPTTLASINSSGQITYTFTPPNCG